MILTEEELIKFNKFFEEHSNCAEDLDLSTIYNVKLVFNLGNDSMVITVICSVCGDEQLLGGPRLYDEQNNK